MCQRHKLLFVLLTTEKTSTVGNHVYLADYDDQKRIRHVGSHLACFHAGNWLLGIIFRYRFSFMVETNWSGGKLANNDTIVNISLQLNDACWNTYAGDAYVFSPPHTPRD
jgi:mannosyl-oligosaccharide alpha-1,2-mannosidase